MSFIIIMLSTPTGRASLSLLCVVILFPALFSYINLRGTLKQYDVCFVGPPEKTLSAELHYDGVMPYFGNAANGDMHDIASSGGMIDSATYGRTPSLHSQYYGIYRTLSSTSNVNNNYDDPSHQGGVGFYHFIKTPFDTSHYCLFADFFYSAENKYSLCGWPSSTTVSNLLSPHTMAAKKDKWQKQNIHNSNNNDNIARIRWDRGEQSSDTGRSRNRWCLTLEKADAGANNIDGTALSQICTEEVPSILSDARVYPFFSELPLSPPPSGVWGNRNSNIQVQCYLGGDDFVVHTPPMLTDNPLATTVASTMNSYNENNKIILQDKKVQWNIFKIPSTFLLITLQIYLFYYRKTNVSTASKDNIINFLSYDNIVYQGELWRAYVSAFSHSSKKHLYLNVYTLYIMGATLEQDFGSTPFLYMNLALVFLVTGVILAVVHLRLKWCEYYHYDPTITNTITHTNLILGYSSVCFAWTTVLCMERVDYPVAPFLRIHHYDTMFASQLFSISSIIVIPLVQLLLCHILFPKESSFLSHIVGLVVGLLLHWDIPSRALLVPQLLLPAVLLADHHFLRMVKKRSYSDHAPLSATAYHSSPNNEAHNMNSISTLERTYELVPTILVEAAATTHPSLNTNMNSSNSSNVHDTDDTVIITMVVPTVRPHRPLLDKLKHTMVVISLIGLFGLDHAMGLSQVLVTLLFYFAVASYNNDNGDSSAINISSESSQSNSNVTMDIIMRRYFLSVTVLIVVDAMTVGSWFLSRIFIISNPTIFLSEWRMKLFFLVKVIVNMIGMMVVASILEKNDDFVNLFGNVFENAKLTGDWILVGLPTRWHRWRTRNSSSDDGSAGNDMLMNTCGSDTAGRGIDIMNSSSTGSVGNAPNIALKRFMV